MGTLLPMAVFVLTWVLMAKERWTWLPIGRAAGTLLGAVLMVAVGGLLPSQALAAVDLGTLTLLLGMMVLTVELGLSGALDTGAALLVRHWRTPTAFLHGVHAATGILSAWLLNDTVCLVATPIVVAACKLKRWPMVPFLVAIATASNVGSIATLVGNPQLMIIGRMSGISFGRWLSVMGPVAIALLVVNGLLLHILFRGTLRKAATNEEMPSMPPLDSGRARRALAVALLMFVAFLAGVDLPLVALGGAVLLMVLRREPAEPLLARVDFGLLLFFAGLFVVVAGVEATGWPRRAMEGLTDGPWHIPSLVLMSNLVSNVPLVLLAGPHTHGESAWYLLGLVSTTAGNLTLVGSAANLIVAERSGLRFREHLPAGLLSTLLTTALGVLLLRLRLA